MLYFPHLENIARKLNWNNVYTKCLALCLSKRATLQILVRNFSYMQWMLSGSISGGHKPPLIFLQQAGVNYKLIYSLCGSHRNGECPFNVEFSLGFLSHNISLLFWTANREFTKRWGKGSVLNWGMAQKNFLDGRIVTYLFCQVQSRPVVLA